jgi:C_GCAxxG_C_C family probable redox protein
LEKVKGTITRRDFAKKSMLAVAALGTTSLIGYGCFNTKKLRSFNNMLKMGHCAPSVMQTLLEMHAIQDTNMVLYAGAMAGGIAGSGSECGALTAPLMFNSFQHGGLSSVEEKLDLINRSQQYVREFSAHNGSCICSKIRDGGMLSCMKAICTFHKPFSKAVSGPCLLSDEEKESYSLLLKAFDERGFHCAHRVLHNLNNHFAITRELLDASWIFIGGLALLNLTCGALTAGVLALSSATAEMEDSYSRTAKMYWLMMHDKVNEAMSEERNHFNRAILLSDELGTWFRNEFGSTTCAEIYGLHFSSVKDVESYISGPCLDHCALIAKRVAEKVGTMV